MRDAADPFALWVVPVAELGGVARHVLDVARHGLPGYRLAVLCPEGPLAEGLRSLGAAVATDQIGPEAGTVRSVASVRHALTALRPAVVHSHLAYADVVTVLAAEGVRPRPWVVSTEHGIAADASVYHGNPALARAREVTHHARLRRTDVVLAVSRSTAEVVRRRWHPACPVRVVLNGVDRPTAPVAAAPGLRCLTLSRLAREKQLGTVLAAIDRLRRDHPHVSLVMAGEGPERAALAAQVQELGLDRHVRMPGHVDPAAALQQADVVVQLSAWENASYTLLDAAASGRGVVATRVGGNPEILPDRCLVGEGASPDEAAARIVSQGEVLTARPSLPEDWPTVGEMCAEIVRAYALR